MTVVAFSMPFQWIFEISLFEPSLTNDLGLAKTTDLSKKRPTIKISMKANSSISPVSSASLDSSGMKDAKEAPSSKIGLVNHSVSDSLCTHVSSSTIKTKAEVDKPITTKPCPEISFPIDEECTSLKPSPSDRLIFAGFTDGML